MKTGLNVDYLDSVEIRKLYYDKKYSLKEIAKELDISFWQSYDFMRRSKIYRRNRLEAGYLASKDKPQFSIKSNLSIAEEKLKTAGIMLYWVKGILRGNNDIFKIFKNNLWS